jgi:hypothetical protein
MQNPRSGGRVTMASVIQIDGTSSLVGMGNLTPSAIEAIPPAGRSGVEPVITTSREPSKQSTHGANRPHWPWSYWRSCFGRRDAGAIQANIDSSRYVLSNSCCSLKNDCLPSPYNGTRETPRMPRRLYIMSSSSVVLRRACQLSLVAMLAVLNSSEPSRKRASIPVTRSISGASWALVPMGNQFASKISIVRGARSSYNVQPRSNHSESFSELSRLKVVVLCLSDVKTSDRKV